MTCPKCQKTVPSESAFCLHCGAPLARSNRLVSVNGGPERSAPSPLAAEASEQPAGKRAYTLGFTALADERLRHRVALWVCDVAPAHPLAEVQAGLLRGSFTTLLALTPEEADLTRRRIEELGVHPAQLRLVPATGLELLLPRHGGKAARGDSRWSPRQLMVAVAAGVAFLLACGLVILRLYGP